MKRIISIVLFGLMVLIAVPSMAAINGKPVKSDINPLAGVWQMCYYISETEDGNGRLISGNSFKILTEDGDMYNLVSIPTKGSIILGYGTYKIVSERAFVEHITKTLDNPVLNGTDNVLEYNLSSDGKILTLKFYIEKDDKGNTIDTWFNETWVRVVMPDVLPADLQR